MYPPATENDSSIINRMRERAVNAMATARDDSKPPATHPTVHTMLDHISEELARTHELVSVVCDKFETVCIPSVAEDPPGRGNPVATNSPAHVIDRLSTISDRILSLQKRLVQFHSRCAL